MQGVDECYEEHSREGIENGKSGGRHAVLNGVVREGFSLLKELQEVRESEFWKSGEEQSGGRSCKCKGPEVGVGSACFEEQQREQCGHNVEYSRTQGSR